MKETAQVSATVEPDLYKEVEAMAKRESRSISSMAAILLQQAVKERNRRKKSKNDDPN